MSNLALKIEGLSKQYRIGKRDRYRTFRDTVTDAFTAPIRRTANLLRGNTATEQTETIWALKDINFEVKHGEVVGIIGRNGAGKSTLLKILSRITEPTTGVIDIYGRVGALLEVGTGFHPELTGRENIFLNGAILGMTREEIKRKFDEIVDFAGVEKFIDTPVKHYSSGMGLRLGFAVAAHLEPEILIVDEVLAVGDAEFQKKCMGKMSEVAGEGRTVLFVSHNMAAVQQLCNRAIWLDKGHLIEDGRVHETLTRYITAGQTTTASIDLIKETNRSQRFMKRITLYGTDGQIKNAISVGEGLVIEVELQPFRDLTHASFGIGINNSLGVRIATITSAIQRHYFPVFNEKVVRCTIPSLMLMPDQYHLKLALSEKDEDIESIDNAITFSIEVADALGSGKLPHSGVVILSHTWEEVELSVVQ